MVGKYIQHKSNLILTKEVLSVDSMIPARKNEQIHKT